MLPLNKINDPEKVLPPVSYTCKTCNGVGWWAEQVSQDEQEQRRCPDCYNGKTQFDVVYNNAIDQYNQVNIDGDVGELARHLYENVYMWGPWDNASITDINECISDARYLIDNLDKFLVIRKGE